MSAGGANSRRAPPRAGPNGTATTPAPAARSTPNCSGDGHSTMTTGTCYLGTDVGGTFTDLVFYTDTGEVHCFKLPSTPARPGASILEGVDEIREALGLDEAAWRRMVHTHSSTVATNALIERKGARVGLLVSSGFRDLFELQRLAIPHPMQFDSRRPLPLVPRGLVREVRGRIAADGSEIDPLDEGDAAA